MDVKKVISIIKRICYQDIYKCHWNVVDYAIIYLEKQIPIKPIKAYDRVVNSHWCSCPTCAKGLNWEHANIKKYCPNCGQAIDWS